ncbi:hypothetical protein BDZ89DRAFT_359083 [Hymenopellis radicata]|nr:hypothetical protein BDZ89DRAFT_359083 [Hymenopellis radicata]
MATTGMSGPGLRHLSSLVLSIAYARDQARPFWGLFQSQLAWRKELQFTHVNGRIYGRQTAAMTPPLCYLLTSLEQIISWWSLDVHQFAPRSSTTSGPDVSPTAKPGKLSKGLLYSRNCCGRKARCCLGRCPRIVAARAAIFCLRSPTSLLVMAMSRTA